MGVVNGSQAENEGAQADACASFENQLHRGFVDQGRLRQF